MPSHTSHTALLPAESKPQKRKEADNLHHHSVWRSSLILSAWSCYLMWAITFLAQWHPLINPKRSDLRPEGGEGHVTF